MALTATATKSTPRAVIKLLKMVHPKVVSVSPNKPNIKYSVLVNAHSLEETFAPLVEEIRVKRMAMDRTIVFCRTYDQCGRIYIHVYGESVGKGGYRADWCVPGPSTISNDRYVYCLYPPGCEREHT